MSDISLRLIIALAIMAVLSVAIIAAVIIIIIVINNKKKHQVYIPPETVTPQQEEIRKTLGETLRELRTERNMTQEFAAESLGVSRQAVSKWENGTSEPSTTNLIAIAKLYGIEPEELLKKLV